MAVLTQTILARVADITSDPQFKRFKLPSISRWMNEGQSIIAERAPRAAAAYREKQAAVKAAAAVAEPGGAAGGAVLRGVPTGIGAQVGAEGGQGYKNLC